LPEPNLEFTSRGTMGHWQSLQLNLPVTSVRDLTIHGDDLLIATHGRSFWILDNITPLRQALEAHGDGGARLYLYRPATRFAWIAILLRARRFAEEPTAENPRMAR